MGSGAAEATGLGFVCFVVINHRVLLANRVDFGLFLFHKFSNVTLHPSRPFIDALLGRKQSATTVEWAAQFISVATAEMVRRISNGMLPQLFGWWI